MSGLIILEKAVGGFGETTDETTSHLTKLQKPQQVIGYSHSTRPATNTGQVAGYVGANKFAPTNAAQ